MPAAQSNVYNGPAGLTLKAWAKINPTNGAILAGNGITSATGGAGSYAVVFSSAMADAFYVVKGNITASAGASDPSIIATTGQTTAGFNLYCRSNVPANVQPSALQFEVWS